MILLTEQACWAKSMLTEMDKDYMSFLLILIRLPRQRTNIPSLQNLLLIPGMKMGKNK